MFYTNIKTVLVYSSVGNDRCISRDTVPWCGLLKRPFSSVRGFRKRLCILVKCKDFETSCLGLNAGSSVPQFSHL